MYIRALLGICLLSIRPEVCYSQAGVSETLDTIDPKTVESITVFADKSQIELSRKKITNSKDATNVIPNAELSQTIRTVVDSINELDKSSKELPSTSTTAQGTFPFGPHLLTSKISKEIWRSGRLFVELAYKIKEGSATVAQLTDEEKKRLECPFSNTPRCNPKSPYRSITGACNNLGNRLWGKSNTPFERNLPADYDDGVSSPRATGANNLALPLPRKISTTIHKASNVTNLDSRFTQMVMEFGQFVSHDIERFAPVQAPDGSELVCCGNPTKLSKEYGCLPIRIPRKDPFFSKYGRRCMEFVRALSTPNLDCQVGIRAQLNQESAYLDGSAVYGSTDELARELRSFSKGLLKTTRGADGELPLQDDELAVPECRSKAKNKCFKCGDPRVNEHPGLISMHTLWLREHNRVARRLASINPSWNDEKLYQEARKIVGAEFQHVVYDEFLPVFVGPYLAKAFDFPAKKSGYNSGYKPNINAQVRSSFSAAAFRVGHSLIQRSLANSLPFRDHFLRPDTMYSKKKGATFIMQNLFMKKQQMSDHLMSPQLLNTLFEQAPGTGIDLAATNIQRGRDFGIPSYNTFRQWCGLPRATHFGTGKKGLVNHSPEAAELLSKAYKNVNDIDLWTGGISEKVLKDAVVGPTLACVIGRQFFLLKKGDRFFYENNDKFAKFSRKKLNQIRKTSLARIICDNTKTNKLQREVFKIAGSKNAITRCKKIAGMDLSVWGTKSSCIHGGWSKWIRIDGCVFGYKFQYRRCNNPVPSGCGRTCKGRSFRWQKCGSSQTLNLASLAIMAKKVVPGDVDLIPLLP